MCRLLLDYSKTSEFLTLAATDSDFKLEKVIKLHLAKLL